MFGKIAYNYTGKKFLRRIVDVVDKSKLVSDVTLTIEWKCILACQLCRKKCVSSTRCCSANSLYYTYPAEEKKKMKGDIKIRREYKVSEISRRNSIKPAWYNIIWSSRNESTFDYVIPRPSSESEEEIIECIRYKNFLLWHLSGPKEAVIKNDLIEIDCYFNHLNNDNGKLKTMTT